MPYPAKESPDSLKYFMAAVRNKAIEITNALPADGNDESKAIATATAQAEKWAENRNMKIRKDNAPEKRQAMGVEHWVAEVKHRPAAFCYPVHGPLPPHITLPLAYLWKQT